jgi:hypothetical protein
VDISIADEPIRTFAQDRLGRSDFVQRAIQVLHGVKEGRASTVIGLVGPWGSGKTSIINLITEGLDGWEVRRLNPWSASDLDSLLGEFFAALVAGLKKPKNDAARKALLTCAEIAMPALSAIPLVGRGAETVARKQVERLVEQGTWADRFDKAAEQLQELEVPILIVIDDMDRLQSDELTGLLKAIRLLGRFPNIHYLVAYDERTIVDILCQSAVASNEPMRAQAFLEKIVQLPLAIPTVPHVHLETLFNNELGSILSDNEAFLSEMDRRRFVAAYETLIRRNMTQLRQIRRYLAQVSAYLPLLGPGEVDIVDFLVLTYIRQSFPQLFRELPTWRAELTRDVSHSEPSDDNVNWFERLKHINVPADLVSAVRDVLVLLFPKVDIKNPLVAIGRGSSGRQVSDRDYFDRYFAYSIPLHDVSDNLVVTALQQAVAGESGDQITKVREIVAGPSATSHEEKLLLIRKLDLLSRELGSEGIVRLIEFAVECFQATTDKGRLLGGEFHACRTWLSHLIVRAAQAGSQRPAEEIFEVLIKGTGIRVTVVILDEASEGPQRETWLTELVGLAEHKVMATIETHLAERTEGDPPAVRALLRFIETTGSGLEDIRARVKAGLQAGRWPISIVAGAFVEVAYSGDNQHAKIRGFTEQPFLQLLSYETVREYFDIEEPPGHVPAHTTEVDVNDVSVESRRQVALRHLRKMRRVDEKFASSNSIGDNSDDA